MMNNVYFGVTMNITFRIAPVQNSIDALGVFTEQSIERKTTIWEANETNMVEVLGYAYQLLDSGSKQFIDTYCSQLTDDWLCRMDETRYINHSDTPNLMYDVTNKTIVALVDIEAGDELTLDYTTFDNSFVVGDQS